MDNYVEFLRTGTKSFIWLAEKIFFLLAYLKIFSERNQRMSSKILLIGTEHMRNCRYPYTCSVTVIHTSNVVLKLL